jgi:hypothetical protein
VRVVLPDDLRQFELGRTPPAMAQYARVRRFPPHIAHELYLVGIEPGGKLHTRPFVVDEHGLDLSVRLQRLATAFVNDSGGGTDVGIGKGGDVLLQEIDEAPFALKQRQELESGRRRESHPHGRGYRRLGGRGKLRLVAHPPYAGSEATIDEDADEAKPRKPEAGRK